MYIPQADWNATHVSTGSALSEAKNANARASTLLRQKFYTSRRAATSVSLMLTALLPWYLWTVGLFVQGTTFV